MSHSISPLHPTRFSVRFFVRWMILLLVATIAIDASAQSQRRKKKRSWKEKVEYADSIRLEIRRASDEGRLLQWGDSILRARRDSGSMDEKKYNALRKRLVKYDQLLHAGNAIACRALPAHQLRHGLYHAATRTLDHQTAGQPLGSMDSHHGTQWRGPIPHRGGVGLPWHAEYGGGISRTGSCRGAQPHETGGKEPGL